MIISKTAAAQWQNSPCTPATCTSAMSLCYTLLHQGRLAKPYKRVSPWMTTNVLVRNIAGHCGQWRIQSASPSRRKKAT